MADNKFTKDPDAVLDYRIDWTTWLDGDSIVSSTWTAESGITIDSFTDSATNSTVWLSGGSAGERYAVTNSIVTTEGRKDDRTIRIRCIER